MSKLTSISRCLVAVVITIATTAGSRIDALSTSSATTPSWQDTVATARTIYMDIPSCPIELFRARIASRDFIAFRNRSNYKVVRYFLDIVDRKRGKIRVIENNLRFETGDIPGNPETGLDSGSTDRKMIDLNVKVAGDTRCPRRIAVTRVEYIDGRHVAEWNAYGRPWPDNEHCP